MKSGTRPKCLHCEEFYTPDSRTRARQRYCSKAECRKASKARSQRRWSGKPENKSYFCGPDNVQRVQRWRKDHPGYWRKPKSAPATLQDALQDECPSQSVDFQRIVAPEATAPPFALQDLSPNQPFVVGLISVLTGSTLQEEIAREARRFFIRGRDILGVGLGVFPPPTHETQTHPLSPAPAARARPI
jgi:hypothetical protein